LKKIKQLSVGKQVLFLFGTLCAILAVIGALFFFSLRSIEGSSRANLSYVVNESELAAAAAQNIGFMQALIFRHIVAADPGEMGTQSQVIHELDKENVEKPAAYQKFVETPEEARLYTQVLNARKNYLDRTEEVLALSRDNRNAEPLQFATAKQFPAYREYQGAIKAMTRYLEKEVRGIAAAMDHRIARIRMVGDISIAIALLVAIGTGFVVTRVARRLKADNHLLQLEITQRKRTADELRESDRRFRDMLGNLELVSMMLDRNAQITYCNDHLLRLTGWQREEVIGQNWFDLFLQIDLAEELHRVYSALLENQPAAWHHENEIVTRSGERRLIRWNNSVLRSASGEAIGTASIGDDITEQKQQEAERQRLQQFQRALLDSIGHGVHGIDMTGRIIFENPAAVKMLGWKPNELTGRPAHTTMHHSLEDGSSYPVEHCPIHATMRDGQQRHVSDETFWRADGTSFPVEFTVAPIRGSRDDITGAVVAFSDIAERKRAETELMRAKEAAEAASRAKSEFLANMSHEIRTPMNGVIGMTGLLLDTDLSKEQEEFAETIRFSGEALLTIVNDILDFSKVEAGQMELDIVDIDLAQLTSGTLELLAGAAKSKGLELHASIDPDVPVQLRADGGRLRQVLINLIGNAIKFTIRGEVTVRISVDRQTEETAFLRFRVTDTGIGINLETQARLFQAFTQADGSTTRRYGGTGLGLAISKLLVEKMHGVIGMESSAGAGSTFWFTVELPRQSKGVARTDSRGTRASAWARPGLRCATA